MPILFRELARQRGTVRVLSDRLRAVLFHSETDLAELLLGGITFAWGVKLLLPIDTWHSGPGGTVLYPYRVMALFPEYAVGAVFFLTGLIWLTGLLVWDRTLRLAGSVLASVLWVFVFYVFGFLNPTLIATETYGLIALACLGCLWRGVVDYQ